MHSRQVFGTGPQQFHGTFQSPFQSVPPHTNDLNKVAKEIINVIAESNEHVTCHKIEELMLQKYKVPSVIQLGLVNVRQLPCIHDLERLETLVNTTVEGYICRRGVCTLYDLDLHILDLLKRNNNAKCPIKVGGELTSFEDLKLGPFKKLPVVLVLFQVSENKPIFKLTTIKLLTHLVEFMNRKRHERVDVADFMEFVRVFHQAENATDLGVKINNFPLVIQTLKRFTQANEQLINDCILECESELGLIVKEAFNNFAASVPFLRVDQDDDIRDSGNRQDLVRPTQYVGEVFSKLHYVYVKIREQTSSYADPKFTSSNATLRKIANLRDLLQKEELISQIFQMAVNFSQDQISEFFNKEAMKETESKPKSILSSEQVVEKLLEYLEICFESGPPSLVALSKIEKKIVDDMQVTHFGDFSTQGFLAFLAENAETKKLLEENGATSLGSSSSSTNNGASYRVPVEELKDIVRQCLRFSGSESSKIIKSAICNHYKVSDVRETGYLGSFDQLMKSKKDVASNNVIYESALLGKSLKKLIKSKRTVGLNGSMSRDQALLCLHNCPLLHDLSEWSNWDVVFKPEHGDITSFLKQNGGIQQVVLETDGKTMQVDVLALEVHPGKLLKLRATSSIEEFRKGVEASDAAVTCGHFVSCLVNQGGTTYFSEELFANTLKVSLMESGTDEEKGKNVARFILECLCTIPILIATSLIQKVFLEPISELLGSVRSKELILEAARGDVRKLNRLELIGFYRGIPAWFEKSFEDKLAPKETEDKEVRRKNKKRKRTRDASLEVEEKKPKNKETLELPANDHSVGDETQMRIMTSSTDYDSQISKDEDVDMETTILPQLDSTSFNPGMKSHWQWLVEDIRKNEFGLGIGLEEDGKKLLEKQQDRLGRSLERLSVDLYSRDAHFLLELVQNADDNQYNCIGPSIPSLQFSLHKDVIVVLNNEVGFRDIDLRAICDVGRTTKGKHKLGYIGQKGIGFKSVFRISDRPEVHSRGLHIKFDLSSGSLGYILPHWIDRKGSVCADSEALKDDGYTTKFVLPLKMAEQTVGIQSKFQDLHPTLLLFLHRLKQIIIKDEIKGEVRSMMRKDIGGNVTEITHDGVVERWLFVKKVVDASEVSKEAKSGIQLQSTELAMAFPVDTCDEKEQQKSNFSLPPKQPLFAFLPLRSYGFRFIIHGDFDVPSSREDVVDNLWNQWLRSKIHVLFLEALEFFKSKDDSDPIREVCMFFKFVPREDEILDFFRQVALNIITNLKTSKCLPSTGESWCYPSQLVMCNDATVRNFVTSELLFNQTGLDYLHPLAVKLVDHSILIDVGVQVLNAKHLLQVGKGILKNIHEEIEDTCQISDGHIQQLHTWLCCIHNTLDDLFTDSCDIIESLKAISFIPLSNGQLVSMDRSVSVFFPFSSDNNSVGSGLGNGHVSKKMVRLLEEDLNSVDNRMFSRTDDQVSRFQVTNILERIGVKKLSDKDLVKHHILHSLKDKEKFKTLSKDLLIAYTVCLKNYFQLHPTSFPTSEVVQNLPISTSKGMVKLKRSSVYFSTDYNNLLNLQQQLPGLKWTTLDSSYLNGNKSLSNVSSWREFFLHLGVQDFLSFKKKKSTFDQKTLESTLWKNYAHLLNEGSTCTIEDWNCDEFKQLVSMDTDDSSVQQQLKKLFELINKFWEPSENSASSVTSISQFTLATIKVDGSDQSMSVQSSFGHLLKSSKWIPVWKLDMDEKKQLLITSPSERVIAESREALAILGHRVQYATVKLENLRKSFADFVGIQTFLEPSYVVQQVVHWSQCTSEDSPLRMTRVYSYLEDSLSKTELSKLVMEHPVIYCPNKSMGGSFLSGHEVCWHDETELIEKYFSDPKKMHPVIPRALSGTYPKSMKDFFTRICSVALSPSAFAYAHVLVHIAATNPVDDSTLASVLKLFAMLEQLLSKEKNEEQDNMLGKISEILKGKQFIPNKAGKWISLEERPIVADNKQFERMFPLCAHYVNVEGLAKGKQSKGSTEFLLRIGVPRLTEIVEVQPVTEMFRPCAELRSHVCSVVPFIQRCLYFEFPSIYEHHVREADIVKKLLNMEFAKVQRLELVHHLRWKESDVDGFPRTAVLPKTCHVFDGVVFVQEDCVGNYLDVNRELAFYFSQITRLCPSLTTSCFNELKSLLSEITPLVAHNDEVMLGKALEERNIFKLPSSEVSWIIGKSGLPAPNVAEMRSSASPVTMETECTSTSVDTSLREAAAASHQPSSSAKLWPLVNHQPNNPHVVNYGSHIQSMRPPVFHYPPISQEQLSQVEVELPLKALREDLELRVNNCQNPEFSGMSGELYVFDYFKKLAESPDSDIAEVTHMNGEGLTTTPYDIVLKRKSDGGLTFIEVKSTTLQDKTWFEISLQELQFAIEKERNYHVYRVFGIGRESGKIRLTKVENLKEVLNTKQAKLAVVFGEKSNL